MKSVFFFEMQIQTSLYLSAVLFYCNFIQQTKFLFLSKTYQFSRGGFFTIFKEIFLKYLYFRVIMGTELEINFKIKVCGS